jgi:hypothetical protein
MEKPETKRINNFLSDIYESFCKDRSAAIQLHLTELYRIIKLLMDETFRTKDQRQKVILPSTDYKTRGCNPCGP